MGKNFFEAWKDTNERLFDEPRLLDKSLRPHELGRRFKRSRLPGAKEERYEENEPHLDVSRRRIRIIGPERMESTGREIIMVSPITLVQVATDEEIRRVVVALTTRYVPQGPNHKPEDNGSRYKLELERGDDDSSTLVTTAAVYDEDGQLETLGVTAYRNRDEQKVQNSITEGLCNNISVPLLRHQYGWIREGKDGAALKDFHGPRTDIHDFKPKNFVDNTVVPTINDLPCPATPKTLIGLVSGQIACVAASFNGTRGTLAGCDGPSLETMKKFRCLS